MIPVRLTIKNFLCYGEGLAPLDFNGVHVVCLCGDNGHGKSALLDAITWALWGQARASRQEDLIHQGKTEMQVDLEFRAGEQEYRVIRKHLKGAKGRQGATDLQLLLGSGIGFRSISENSVRETEAKIRHLLRMDYSTFINTAFLMQGRSDQFTTSSPMDRKRLLADVLSLDAYEEASDRARDRARSMEREERRIQGEIDVWNQQIQNLPSYRSELEASQTKMDKLEPILKDSQEGILFLEERLRLLHLQQQELNNINGVVSRASAELKQIQEQLTVLEERLRQLMVLIERKEEIYEGYSRWQQLQDEEEALEVVRLNSDLLVEQKRILERAEAQDRERQSNEVDRLRNRIEQELFPKINRRANVEENLHEALDHQTILDKDENSLREKRRDLEDLGDLAQEAATRQKLLKEDMDLLNARTALFSQTNVSCPMCNTPLAPDSRTHLEDEIRLQEKQLHERRLVYQKELRTLEIQRQDLRREVGDFEEQLIRRRRDHQVVLANLHRELDETEKAAEESIRLEEELAALEQLLSNPDVGSSNQQQLHDVNLQMEKLGYDSGSHQRVRQEARSLVHYHVLHAQLKEALIWFEQERRSLQAYQDMAQLRADEGNQARERQAFLEESLLGMPLQERRLADAKRSWEALDVERTDLNQVITRRGYDVERLQLVGEKKTESEASLNSYQSQRNAYEDLSLAFGKNGIQAYLIDEALPELELEANALLHRLTDSRLSLKLETQRQRRTTKGEPIETLDIYIGDELTPARSYELFSGGEAFRINIALRIALSKVLAHRAGAPLPTLFIDEGFGTQDATGRERLVEVINSIQDDFERIIVVTHIEELKELFPVRIEVQKTPAGSIFWMN
jgi:exonuclease SbcC